MDNVINVVATGSNDVTTETPIVKTHPRLYTVANLTFNDEICGIKIPYATRSAIIKAIESAGFSITYLDDCLIAVTTLKKAITPVIATPTVKE